MILLGTLAVQTAQANSGGITGRSKTQSTCNSCHGGGNFNSQLELQGADTVASGELADFIISLTHTGSEGGFNMSAEGGELIAGSGSFVNGGELTHIRPQTVSSGNNSWAVQWQAPNTAGDYRLFVCANAVNGDNTIAGDETVTRCEIKTITVGTSNAAPVATNDSASTAEDSSVTIDVLDNDSDEDGSLDSSTVTVVNGPSNGSASVNGSGTITYSPDANFFGSDSFSYQVQDNEGETSNSATVSISVTSVNDVPVANADAASTAEDTAVSINVLSNDTDVEGELDSATITIESEPQNGTATVENGMIRYLPNDGFSGSDSFEYSVADESGERSNNALVTISVVAVNDAPSVVADAASTNEDTSVEINVLANDSDSDGSIDATTVEIENSPTNGDVSVNNTTGLITYTPDTNFFGTDSFAYSVADNEGGRSGSATVEITIISINDAPVAANDTTGTNLATAVEINVLSNDSDVDGDLDISSIIIESAPTSGSAVIESSGSITYTPNDDFTGTDTFTYSVADDGGERSNTATVSVAVRVNEAPNANADTAETEEDTAVTINVLSNDSDDIELDPSSVTIVTSPEAASVSVNSNSGAVTFTPNPNVFGEQQFSYQVSDFEGGISEETLVTVTVNAVNDAPVITSEPVTSITQGELYEYEVVASDVENDELTYSLETAPEWLSISGNVISGTPPVSAIGEHNVVIRVDDGSEQDEQAYTLLVAERTDADLSVILDSLAPALVDSDFSISIVLSNAGPADASDVSLHLEFSRELQFVTLPDGCSQQATAVNCSGLFVANGTDTELGIVAQADAGGDLLMSAEVNFAEENNQSNNLTRFAMPISGSLLALESVDDAAYVSVATADINQDGFLDAVYVSSQGGDHQVMLNVGSGQMALSQLLSAPENAKEASLADVNNDDLPDLIIGATGASATHLYINNGDGGFDSPTSIDTGEVVDLLMADINSDAALDVVVVTAGGDIQILLNDGVAGFVLVETIEDAGACAVAAIDINSDGAFDLVTANGVSGGTLYVNQLQSEGRYYAQGEVINSGSSVSVTSGDFNSDGVLDVVFANLLNGGEGATGANTLFVAMNGTLQKVADIGQVSTSGIQLADFNDDGLIDMLLLNAQSVHQTYLQQGDASWSLQSGAVIATANQVAVADINGDGLVDSLFAGSSRPEQSMVFRTAANDLEVANADVSVSISSSADVVMRDETMTVEIIVSNGSSDYVAQNILLTASLSETFNVTVIPDICEIAQGNLNCEIPQIAQSGALTIEVVAEITADTGSILITPQVSALTPDNSSDNNNASLSVVINAAPIANNDSATVEQNQTVSIGLLSNDTDDHGFEASSVTIVSAPANGSVSVGNDGSVVYTPTTDYTGSDSFTYQVSDSYGLQSNVATVSISVTEKSGGGGGSLFTLLYLLSLMTLLRRRRITKVF